MEKHIDDVTRGEWAAFVLAMVDFVEAARFQLWVTETENDPESMLQVGVGHAIAAFAEIGIQLPTMDKYIVELEEKLHVIAGDKPCRKKKSKVLA